MEYRVEKPLRYFTVGQAINVNPAHPYNQSLERAGIIAPVKKRPKSERREKKVVTPSEVKHDREDD